MTDCGDCEKYLQIIISQNLLIDALKIQLATQDMLLLLYEKALEAYPEMIKEEYCWPN